jgi:hypothetical protein
MNTVLYACKCKEMQVLNCGSYIATTRGINCQISPSYITGKCINCQKPFRIYNWMSLIPKPAQGPEASTEQELMSAHGHSR